MDQEFVYELGDARFLPVYLQAVEGATDGKVFAVVTYVVTRIANLAFVKDYVNCREALLKLFERPDLFDRTVPMFQEILKHQAAVDGFKLSALPAVLGQLSSNPKVGAAATRLLGLLR